MGIRSRKNENGYNYEVTYAEMMKNKYKCSAKNCYLFKSAIYRLKKSVFYFLNKLLPIQLTLIDYTLT